MGRAAWAVVAMLYFSPAPGAEEVELLTPQDERAHLTTLNFRAEDVSAIKGWRSEEFGTAVADLYGTIAETLYYSRGGSEGIAQSMLFTHRLKKIHAKRSRHVIRMIDRVFEIIFARYRRKMGDSNLSSAWRTASSRVTGYIAVPAVAVLLVAIMALYSFKRIGTPVDDGSKWLAQLTAGLIATAIAVLLDRRFKKYLVTPPVLASCESRADKKLVLWFRVFAIGAFALACLIALLLHVVDSLFLSD